MFGVAINSKVKTIQSDQFDEPNESDLNDEWVVVDESLKNSLFAELKQKT